MFTVFILLKSRIFRLKKMGFWMRCGKAKSELKLSWEKIAEML
jgi:hypothetical protein